MSLELEILQLFPSQYDEVLKLQLDLVNQRAKDAICDTLILTEHHPVFTAGRRVTPESLPTSNEIPLVEVTRGGNVTYHGPGQIVGYWIRKLDGKDRDLHAHLRLVEELLINVCDRLGLLANRVPDLTGVWLKDKKIASIGVAVRSWVTYHGFALNVDVNSDIYKMFKPCGLSGNVMSDLNAHLAAPLRLTDVVAVIEEVFSGQYAK